MGKAVNVDKYKDFSMTNINSVLSRAPLRIGLAGGGTDIKDFYDLYGKTLSVAIDRYVHCRASLVDHNSFNSLDRAQFCLPDTTFDVSLIPSSVRLHYQVLVGLGTICIVQI